METATYPHDALPRAAELPREDTPAPSRPVAVSLTMPRAQAAREILNQSKIGEAIAYQRIRDRWSLDQARTEKQEWVQRTYDLLTRLFTSNVVAERCNDWVARLLPEYAPLEDFIELFEIEMRHRLGRLQSVLKRLRDVPDVNQQTTVMRLQVSDPNAEVIPDRAEDDINTESATASPDQAETDAALQQQTADEPDMIGQVTLRESVAVKSPEPAPEPAPEAMEPVEAIHAEPAPSVPAAPEPAAALSIPYAPAPEPAAALSVPCTPAPEPAAVVSAPCSDAPTQSAATQPAPVQSAPVSTHLPLAEPAAEEPASPAAAEAEVRGVYGESDLVYSMPAFVMTLQSATPFIQQATESEAERAAALYPIVPPAVVGAPAPQPATQLPVAPALEVQPEPDIAPEPEVQSEPQVQLAPAEQASPVTVAGPATELPSQAAIESAPAGRTSFAIRSSAVRSAWTLGDFDPIV